ncbi:protein lap1 isoform X2 [Diachasmimorpha longicaudata]
MMTLPKSMSRLTNLQRLDIGNNDFTELPEVVGDLTNLTELWIDGNDIRRIPANIEQLYRLNHFDCTMNAVHELPSEIQGWRDISIINFSSNELYQLPDTLCYLRTIVTLKIDDNQLNSLPDDIGQMSNLEELIVTKNFLEQLPSSIGLLRKLHCLNADNNYLRALPSEIGSCCALSLLSLRSNNISGVPPELGHLSSLRVLNLVNNCIQFLPVSMLNLTNLKALWLSDNQSQPLVPLQQEFNRDEDMMVLSCFMLPQKQRKELEQMEQAVGPISGSIVGTGRRICFAAEVDTEVPRQLHRAPTPYPKELRNLARHARNLQHQSLHDQRIHLERDGLIKEAVVAKSSPSLNLSNSQLHPLSSIPSSPKCHEDPLEESNQPVLAQEKSPEIREAKCVRNPGSEYLSRPPTIADYVSSTWKPEEYSRTNTAKIVESEKLAEAHKNPESSPSDQSKSNNDPPLSPPPYHIAAAFSKKAALFQQLNRCDLVDEMSTHSHKIDNHSRNSFNDTPQVQLCQNNNQNKNEQIDGDVGGRIIDHPVHKNLIFKEDRPSRIPILRGKNHETVSDTEGNFTADGNCNLAFNDFDDKDKSSEGFLSGIEGNLSPMTGRKYRSPLSSTYSQLRHSDRGKKINGSFREGLEGLSGQIGNNSVEMQNEKNSGRSTPVRNGEGDVNGVERSKPKDEGKPKLKWMFGPHRNVNVIPVQVRKNPGLGFSIAGGVVGNETGIIVTKVNPDGPAQGTLRPGDKILEVDGIDFTKSDHDSAVAILRSTGAVVTMLISRHQ